MATRRPGDHCREPSSKESIGKTITSHHRGHGEHRGDVEAPHGREMHYPRPVFPSPVTCPEDSDFRLSALYRAGRGEGPPDRGPQRVPFQRGE